MRILAAALVSTLPGMAVAHPGHLTDLAGHDHWVAGAAIGIAIVLGAWAALKGQGKESSSAAEGDEAASDPQDA